MAVYLSPLWGAGAQLFDLQGVILAGGFINTFLAGTTTPVATFTDNTGTVPNGVSIQLDSSGRPPAEIWLTGGVAYKFQLTDVNAVQIGLLFDNISGINDPGTSGVAGVSPWNNYAGTLSYISSTQFSTTGNQTAVFPVGTRIKYAVTAGIGEGTVSAVAFGSFTTVTIIPDGTNLDNGLSAVAVSINDVATKNVSASAVDYKSSITYPAGTIGAAVQSQGLYTVTTGTSTAYILAPPIPITTYSAGQIFPVEFNQASGTNPTINISAKGPKNLMQYNGSGAKIPAVLYANQISYVSYDGTDMVVLEPVKSSGKLLRITPFTASGTWTQGADVGSIVVEAVGAGGGSYAGGTGGGGGGSGAYSKKFISSPTTPVTVTVGTGGVAGAPGGAGGDTSFGFAVIAKGGAAGGLTAGGLGGLIIGGAGDVLLAGGGGSYGGAWSANIYFGAGGNSFMGGGSPGDLNRAGGVNGSANTGGGGSGGSGGGGNGGSGYVVVYEYAS